MPLKLSHLRFEPAGFTTNRDIPMAKSLVDYIFRYMATKFMDTDAQHQVWIDPIPEAVGTRPPNKVPYVPPRITR